MPEMKGSAEALALTLQLIRDVREKGITQGEFEFARDSLINSSGFMYNTPAKRVENKLLERTLDLPAGLMQSYAAELGKVTLEDHFAIEATLGDSQPFGAHVWHELRHPISLQSGHDQIAYQRIYSCEMRIQATLALAIAHLVDRLEGQQLSTKSLRCFTH